MDSMRRAQIRVRRRPDLRAPKLFTREAEECVPTGAEPSVPSAGYVPAMADGRRRSTAKQARRDARRRKAGRREPVEPEPPKETPLIDEVRQALDGGRPMDLLDLVSLLILATSAQQPVLRPQPDGPGLDELVTAFIGVQVPETTALLTVLGELILDDDVLRARCRTRSRLARTAFPDGSSGWRRPPSTEWSG